MNEAHKIEMVERYVAAYNAQDLDAMLSLFREDAVMEDPVGSPPAKGREAIAELYRTGFGMGVRIELDGRIRCAGPAVAFPLRAAMPESELYIIDVFELGADGRIERMRAYWSPEASSPEADGTA